METTITQVVQKVGPAVVTVVGVVPGQATFFGTTSGGEVSGSGTVAEGLGFAIPANTVQAVAGQIIATGRFACPYLGVQFQTITPYIARMYRLPVEYGAYVTGVVAGSPAAQAGLQEDDIIFRIGEVELDETHSYINALFGHQPGEAVTIGFVRNGEALEVQVVLGET